MTITWRNVTAGSDSAALAAVGDAGRNIGSGINAIGTALEGVSNLNQRGLERELSQQLQSYREGIQEQHSLFTDTLKEAESNPLIADIDGSTGKIHLIEDSAILQAAGITDPNSEEAAMAIQNAKDDAADIGRRLNDMVSSTPTAQQQENYIRRLSQSAGQQDDAIGRNVDNYLFTPSQGGGLSPQAEHALELQQQVAEEAIQLANLKLDQSLNVIDRRLQPYDAIRSDYTSGSTADNTNNWLSNRGFDVEDGDLAEATDTIISRFNQALNEKSGLKADAEEAGLLVNGRLDLSNPVILINALDNAGIDKANDLDGLLASSEAERLGTALQSAIRFAAEEDTLRDKRNSIQRSAIRTVSDIRMGNIRDTYNTRQRERAAKNTMSQGITFDLAK